MEEVSVVGNPFAQSAENSVARTASSEGVVQREISEVQAALVVAKRFPRDPIQAMDRILQSCTRLGLAEGALYQYARGGQDISGPSIRLAETIAQHWGNISSGVVELSRRNGESECLAYAWDLETNFRDEKRFIVKHIRNTRRGSMALSEERDIYETVANSAARRKRACLLAVIPGDVVESATRQVELTLRTSAEISPDRIKAMLETFAEYGIAREMIEQRIQRRLDAITPALFLQLGKIANGLKDGMSSASDWFEVAPKQTAADDLAQEVMDKISDAQQPVSRMQDDLPEEKDELQPEAIPEEPNENFDLALAVWEGAKKGQGKIAEQRRLIVLGMLFPTGYGSAEQLSRKPADELAMAQEIITHIDKEGMPSDVKTEKRMIEWLGDIIAKYKADRL
jgi:hypothetical protein